MMTSAAEIQTAQFGEPNEMTKTLFIFGEASSLLPRRAEVHGRALVVAIFNVALTFYILIVARVHSNSMKRTFS